MPKADGERVKAPRRATFVRDDGGYAVYTVGAGSFMFTSERTVL